MEDLHRRSHRAARRAVVLKKRGRNADASALLEEVLKMSEEMQVLFEASLHSALPPAVVHPELRRAVGASAKLR